VAALYDVGTLVTQNAAKLQREAHDIPPAELRQASHSHAGVEQFTVESTMRVENDDCDGVPSLAKALREHEELSFGASVIEAPNEECDLQPPRFVTTSVGQIWQWDRFDSYIHCCHDE